MSDKMEKYRDKHAEVTALEHVDETEYCFRAGFDAAIALDLPVKFSIWLRENYSTQEMWDDYQLDSNKWRGYGNDYEEKDVADLYKHWIDNVYKPE